MSVSCSFPLLEDYYPAFCVHNLFIMESFSVFDISNSFTLFDLLNSLCYLADHERKRH